MLTRPPPPTYSPGTVSRACAKKTRAVPLPTLRILYVLPADFKVSKKSVVGEEKRQVSRASRAPARSCTKSASKQIKRCNVRLHVSGRPAERGQGVCVWLYKTTVCALELQRTTTIPTARVVRCTGAAWKGATSCRCGAQQLSPSRAPSHPSGTTLHSVLHSAAKRACIILSRDEPGMSINRQPSYQDASFAGRRHR
jgi:hypothetical protein